MKLIVTRILLCTYLFLLVRPAVPLAADFIAHTLWSHHHFHAHHHHGHNHLNDDLSAATDDHGPGDQKQLHDYKTELYFAPDPLEFHFELAVLNGPANFIFHPLMSLAEPSAASPPPEMFAG